MRHSWDLSLDSYFREWKMIELNGIAVCLGEFDSLLSSRIPQLERGTQSYIKWLENHRNVYPRIYFGDFPFVLIFMDVIWIYAGLFKKY